MKAFVSWQIANEFTNSHRLSVIEFIGDARSGYTATVLAPWKSFSDGRTAVDRSREVRVEEPFPLDFPSETWKQRVMLLA